MSDNPSVGANQLAWEQAWTTFSLVEEDRNRFQATIAGEVLSHSHAARPRGLPSVDQLEDEAAFLDDMVGAAAGALLITPAPDLSALLWKLERMFGDDARDGDGDGAAWCREYVDALMSDARALLARV